ncbi:hypothetical protein EDB19DRAFT_1279396 [Suillus lakei]|nr:hypothetical protein EDB19DRAFT_1279396 [Suillus lakei]
MTPRRSGEMTPRGSGEMTLRGSGEMEPRESGGVPRGDFNSRLLVPTLLSTFNTPPPSPSSSIFPLFPPNPKPTLTRLPNETLLIPIRPFPLWLEPFWLVLSFPFGLGLSDETRCGITKKAVVGSANTACAALLNFCVGGGRVFSVGVVVGVGIMMLGVGVVLSELIDRKVLCEEEFEGNFWEEGLLRDRWEEEGEDERNGREEVVEGVVAVLGRLVSYDLFLEGGWRSERERWMKVLLEVISVLERLSLGREMDMVGCSYLEGAFN